MYLCLYEGDNQAHGLSNINQTFRLRFIAGCFLFTYDKWDNLIGHFQSFNYIFFEVGMCHFLLFFRTWVRKKLEASDEVSSSGSRLEDLRHGMSSCEDSFSPQAVTWSEDGQRRRIQLELVGLIVIKWFHLQSACTDRCETTGASSSSRQSGTDASAKFQATKFAFFFTLQRGSRLAFGNPPILISFFW